MKTGFFLSGVLGKSIEYHSYKKWTLKYESKYINKKNKDKIHLVLIEHSNHEYIDTIVPLKYNNILIVGGSFKSLIFCNNCGSD